MKANIKSNKATGSKILSSSKGFTIIELLVVIVVIGILTAITIVSYSGITAKANTSANAANADNLMTKINTVINDDIANAIPITFSDAIKATDSSPALTGISNFGFGDASGATAATNLSVTAGGVVSMSKAPATSSTVMFQVCGYKKLIASPNNQVAITKPISVTEDNLTAYYNELTTDTPAGVPTYTGVVTGIKVSSWKYSAPQSQVDKTYGVTSGTLPGVLPPVNIYCVPSKS